MTSLGDLRQCLTTLTKKKGVSYFEWNFLCFCLHPLFFVLSVDTTEKGLAPTPLDAHQVSIHIDRVLLCRPPAAWVLFPHHGNDLSIEEVILEINNWSIGCFFSSGLNPM